MGECRKKAVTLYLSFFQITKLQPKNVMYVFIFNNRKNYFCRMLLPEPIVFPGLHSTA